jgi:hypothetical protein
MMAISDLSMGAIYVHQGELVYVLQNSLKQRQRFLYFWI